MFQTECEKLVDLQIAVIWLNLPLLESIKVINLFPDLDFSCRARGCYSVPYRMSLMVYFPYTVKPPNKGHVGDNITAHALSCVYREIVLFSDTEQIFGLRELSTVERFLIQCTVSLSRRVHYRRFHCTYYRENLMNPSLFFSTVALREKL